MIGIMPKLLIDFLSSNWVAISQYPLTFIIMGIVVGFIGFFVGTNCIKNQNDALRSQIDSLDKRFDLEKLQMNLLREEELRKKAMVPRNE